MKKESVLNKKEWMLAIDTMKGWTGDKTRAFSLCPYFIHPIRVASLVAKYKESHKIDWLVIAALFHDIVEDTQHTLLEIEALYGKEVASLVFELTSIKEDADRLGKTQYLCNKLEHMSSWALVIKLCDRLDNVSDFSFAPQTFVDKYAIETITILDHIEKSRELSDTHKRIISDIRSTVNIYYKAA